MNRLRHPGYPHQSSLLAGLSLWLRAVGSTRYSLAVQDGADHLTTVHACHPSFRLLIFFSRQLFGLPAGSLSPRNPVTTQHPLVGNDRLLLRTAVIF